VRDPASHEGICRTVALAWGAGALWTTGQGRVRVGRQHAREVPCGISRVGPQGGVATWDDEDDGLVSAFGRDVTVDARDAVVSFGIQGDGLALLDPQARSRWRHRRAASSIRLNANAVALSPGAIWLATPDGRRPLVRYDRLHGEARRVRAVPENHWVRALAADAGGAWAAFVRERWVDGAPIVETWVLRAREAGPRLTASDTSAQRAPRAWPGGRRGRTDP